VWNWPHFHLAQRLRMSWAIPLLPVSAFVAWTGTFSCNNAVPERRYVGLLPTNCDIGGCKLSWCVNSHMCFDHKCLFLW
jgi:hypothetical protein